MIATPHRVLVRRQSTGVPVAAGRHHACRARPGPGGGTEAFAVGASFVGFLVFVTFIALIAAEFSGGTFRALLLREPAPAAGDRRQAGRRSSSWPPASSRWPRCSRSCCRWSSRRPRTSPPTEWFSLASLGAALPRLPHRPGRRRRLGDLRHHPRRDLPLGAARPRRRVRLGRAVREHRRRLVAGRLPLVPRPGARLADPGRHRRAGHRPGRLDRRALHRDRRGRRRSCSCHVGM